MRRDRSTFQAIAASWIAMKTWVKLWLFALNGVFLAAIAFWPSPEAKWTLLAYVASGPLLAMTMAYQRGLTRLLGWTHLVPWTPLLIFLGLRLGSDRLGPPLSPHAEPTLYFYVAVLFAAVAFCLAADFYDLIRWAKGERYILGSPEAVARGASHKAPDRLPCEAALA